MKIKALVFLLLISTAGFSCKNSADNKCPVFPVALQLLTIKVKIVDKTSGADLFLSPGSPYKFKDLVLTQISGQNIGLFPDTTQKTDRFVMIATENSQTFSLKLGPLTADTIAMSVLTTPTKCSEILSLNAVSLDGKVICSPCSTGSLVTIKK